MSSDSAHSTTLPSHALLCCWRLYGVALCGSYEQARVAQARAEVARQRTDGECTFKPELVTRKSIAVQRDGTVFDTLYKKVRPTVRRVRLLRPCMCLCTCA